MTYAYQLAGEDVEMAKADLQGFLRSQNVSDNLEIKENLALSSEEPSQLRRLALTHEVGKVEYRGDISDFQPELPEGTFEVRAKIMTDEDRNRENLEEQLGSVIESDERSVDLESPDFTYTVYVFDVEIIVATQIIDIDRGLFQKRSNEKRPYSSPVSLNPVLARFMVNLTGLEPGKYVFDPFCGTGGLLIEAGLCGIGVRGADISDEMVNGCERNLEHYGIINHKIKKKPVGKSLDEFESFDAIITDLPYGKASRKDEDPINTFISFIDSYDGRVVFCYNEPSVGKYESEFELYVHKNLTRYVYVI